MRYLGSLVVALILIAPALCASWAAGWAYLNVELWAHRHYLAYLDRRMFGSDRVALHNDLIEGTLYASRPRKNNRGLTYANHLNILVAFFPAVVGIVSVGIATSTLMKRDGWFWIVGAIIYAIVVLTLYFRVFYIKVRISRAVKERIRIKEQSTG